jgi:hypothetical protein
LGKKGLGSFAGVRKGHVRILTDIRANALSAANDEPGLSIFPNSDSEPERRIVMVLARLFQPSYC